MCDSNTSNYNYAGVLNLEHVHKRIGSYITVKTLFVSVMCCNSVWNKLWKSVDFDKQLKNNFNNEYGKDIVKILGHEWPILTNN